LVNKDGAHTNNNLIYCGVIEAFVSAVHVSLLGEERRGEDSQSVERGEERRGESDC